MNTCHKKYCDKDHIKIFLPKDLNCPLCEAYQQINELRDEKNKLIIDRAKVVQDFIDLKVANEIYIDALIEKIKSLKPEIEIEPISFENSALEYLKKSFLK